MVKRRTFLKLGSSFCLAGVFSFSNILAAYGNPDITEHVTRLTAKQLADLGVTFPLKNFSIPTGGSIDVVMKPDVIRRYGDAIYTHYELLNHIVIYDLGGQLLGRIPLTDPLSSLKDFAIDEELQLVYLLSQGAGSIAVIDFNGDFINRIGEFGIDLVEQLNGARSITLDKNKHLHVLCAGDNTIKVFADSGAFVEVYSSVFGSEGLNAKSIDGISSVIPVGGPGSEQMWRLSLTN